MSTKLKPWLVLAVIFLAGILTGVGLTIGLGAHFKHAPEPREKMHLFDFLNHRLNLTADQQAKVQPITVDAETKLHALHHEELERGSQIFKAMDDQISVLLTPAQQAELQKVESDRQKMFSGHMHPWGAPGGPSHHEGPGGNPPPGSSPPPPPPGQPAPANPAPTAPST
jgi:Spy/CpxP family protein refolding chaperone